MYIQYKIVGYDVKFWIYHDDIKNKVIGRLIINDAEIDKFELTTWDKIDYIQKLYEDNKLFIYDALMLVTILPDKVTIPYGYLNDNDDKELL